MGTRSASMSLDLATPDGLRAYACLLESGADIPAPPIVAAAARAAADRLAASDDANSCLKEALIVVNHMSAHGLRKAAACGEDAGKANGDGPGLLSSLSARDEEPSRAFMIKKGDADVQEKFQATMSRQCSPGSSTNSGGTLSDAKSLTKEEMMKAREARLAQLEAKAAEKNKAREAMFNRQFVGPAKPMGKH